MRKINRWVLIMFTLAAVVLRFLQNRTGYDELGLAVHGNLPGILLPIVLTLAVLWFGTLSLTMLAERDPTVSPAMYFLFSDGKAPVTLAVSGAFLVLLGALLSLISAGGSLQTLLSSLFLLVSAGCIFYAAAALYRGREVSGIALLVPVCALVVHLIFLYRADATDPVLARIYIELLAVSALTLSALERAAIVFRNGLPRVWPSVCAMSVILGMAAAVDFSSPAAAALFAGLALAEAGFLCATGFI